MTQLHVRHAGTVKMSFTVSASGALSALTGSRSTCSSEG